MRHKQITVPADIDLVDVLTDKPITGDVKTSRLTFATWAVTLFSRVDLFTTPTLPVMSAMDVADLRTKIKPVKSGERLNLIDAEHAYLAALAKHPVGLNPIVALQAIAFEQAILDAVDNSGQDAKPKKAKGAL